MPDPPRCGHCHRTLKAPSPDGLGPVCRRRLHPTPVRLPAVTVPPSVHADTGQAPLFHIDQETNMPNTPDSRPPLTDAEAANHWYDKWDATVTQLNEQVNTTNGAYRERAQLVALLAAIYPSHIGHTDPNEPEWAVVIIETPAGQLSWHVSPADIGLFAHVPPTTPSQRGWDGHSTAEKYQRIAQLGADEATRRSPRSVDSGFNDFDIWWHRELETFFVNCRICHTEKAVWQHERPDESVRSDTAHLIWIVANHRHGETGDGWEAEES